MSFLYQWIDSIWLVVAFFAVHKSHRWMALGFVVASMLMMRLEVELMESIGYPHGILSLLDGHIFNRALAIYSVFYLAYFVLAWYSPGTRGVVFMAASISIFFMALFVSALAMVL